MKPLLGGAANCALVALLGTAVATAKPPAYQPPRLPDGHVDMQGMWKNSNLTPLERHSEFTQLVISAADAARLEQQYQGTAAAQGRPDDPGQALEARSIEPIRGELRSSLIIDPQDGKIPWNAAHAGTSAELRRAVLTAFDNPEQRPSGERCLASTAAPPMQPTIDNNLYKMIQIPGYMVIESELIHDARTIRMNGVHSSPVITSWLGDSIGWWEKQTLVVETKYFSTSSAARIRGADIFLVSPRTVVVERFTRVSDNELNYVFTVTDPTYYSRPWTGETHFLRSQGRIYEFACHEGNYSMRDMLEAARDHDAAAPAKAPAMATK